MEQNYNKAMEYYRRAADQGCDYALIAVGSMYWPGLGVEQNKETAREYFRKASESGDQLVLTGLGIMVESGMITEEDYKPVPAV